jgi:DNA-binding NarL/FixJ family response regulator
VTIRVLIADDQAMVREGLRMILDLQDDIEVVAEAADGQAALRAVAEHAPDVVLMDIRMPGMDGLQATERLLRGGRAGPRVLVLTTFGEDEYLYRAMRAGASGFLLKDVPPAELAHAVRTVAAGEPLLAPSITRRLVKGAYESGLVRPGAEQPVQPHGCS